MKNSQSNLNKHLNFIKVWGFVHNDTKNYFYWIKKGGLSISEIKLLNAFYLYKKNKKQECLELVKTQISDDIFLEATRYYLIGLIYNQFCHYSHAIQNLKRSILLFEESGESEFILNPLCVLANVYGNRREVSLMAECLDNIKEFNPRSDLQKIQVMYAEICFCNISDQNQKAEYIYKKVKEKGFLEYEAFRPYFMTIMFMIYSKEKNTKNVIKY